MNLLVASRSIPIHILIFQYLIIYIIISSRKEVLEKFDCELFIIVSIQNIMNLLILM